MTFGIRLCFTLFTLQQFLMKSTFSVNYNSVLRIVETRNNVRNAPRYVYHAVSLAISRGAADESFETCNTVC